MNTLNIPPLPRPYTLFNIVSWLISFTVVWTQLILYFWKSRFTRIPVIHADLTDETVIVTGANTGLGLAAAKYLARVGPAWLILA
jgi:NADPH:quinone reductase-like Zn-dependent oxidoreductase